MRSAVAKGLVIVIALAAITWLFSKTRLWTAGAHTRTVSLLGRFDQLDAVLNEEILRVRYGLARNYDLLVDASRRASAVLYELKHGADSLYRRGHRDIDARLDALAALQSKKALLLEDFKTSNSALKTSFSYFPIAARRLANAAEEVEEVDKAAAEGLGPTTRQLFRGMLLYGVKEDAKSWLVNVVQNLRLWRGSQQKEIEGQINLVAKLAELILETQQQVTVIVGRFIGTPTAAESDRLEQSYLAYYEDGLRASNRYRLYLFLCATLLLGYVILMYTRLRQNARELTEEKELVQVTLHSIGDAVITSDATGAVTYLNPVAEQLTGWTRADAKGRPLSEVFPLFKEESREPIDDPVAIVLDQRRQMKLPPGSVLVNKEGTTLAVETSLAPIRSWSGDPLGVVIAFHDVTDARRMAREMSWQATHDPLTELVNRREFENRVKRVLERLHRGIYGEHALLYLDLDRFKMVNDTCGHVAGDQLLRKLSLRLEARVRSTDTLARLGGDEFGVLLENCPVEQARAVAEKLRQEVKDFRFHWRDRRFEVGASIGVVPIDDTAEDVAGVLSSADMACYAAKESGRNRVNVFRPADTVVAQRHGEIRGISRVTKGIDEDRFVLFAQQIIDCTPEKGPTQHYELLLRLREQTGELVLPGAFIPAAERYRLMANVDRWVLRNAFEQMAKVPAAPGESRLFSINLSGQSFADDKFLDFVVEQLKGGVVAKEVCFEITETAAIARISKAQKFIEALSGQGCSFSLDDFGTGLSSFSYLKSLPVDYVKIDGTFVRGLTKDPVDRTMVEMINQIGHVMGMETIAEQVEDQETLDGLRTIGVDYAQGYGIARPVDLATVLGPEALAESGEATSSSPCIPGDVAVATSQKSS